MAVNKGEIGIYGILVRDGGDNILAKAEQIKDEKYGEKNSKGEVITLQQDINADLLAKVGSGSASTLEDAKKYTNEQLTTHNNNADAHAAMLATLKKSTISSATGQPIISVSQENGIVDAKVGNIEDAIVNFTAIGASADTVAVTGTTVEGAITSLGKSVKTVDKRIDDLDAGPIGGTGKYIQVVQQTDGKLSATAGDLNSAAITDLNAKTVPFDGYTGSSSYKIDATNVEDALIALGTQTKTIKTNPDVYDVVKVTEGLASNVREAYQVKVKRYNFNSASYGNLVNVGVPINIYKDSSLKNVELVDQDDKGNTGNFLKLTYLIEDGTEKVVYCDVSKLLAESEFGDGLTVSDAGIVSVKAGDGLKFVADGENNKKLTVAGGKGMELADDGTIGILLKSDEKYLEADAHNLRTKGIDTIESNVNQIWANGYSKVNTTGTLKPTATTATIEISTWDKTVKGSSPKNGNITIPAFSIDDNTAGLYTPAEHNKLTEEIAAKVTKDDNKDLVAKTEIEKLASLALPDEEMSETSTNTVQNKAVYAKIKEINEVLRGNFAKIAFNVSPTTIERGVSTKISMSWAYNYNGTTTKITSPDTMQLLSGSTVLADTGTTTYSENISEAKSYQVKATVDGVNTYSSTVTVRAYYPMYFGECGETFSSATLFVAANKQSIRSSAATSSVNVTFTGKKYLWLCIPTGVSGVNSVKSSGFSVPMEAGASQTVNGIAYTCYRSTDTVNAGTVNYAIS